MNGASLDFGRAHAHKARPMGIQVKICGINSLDAADAALRGGAEFAGLNFHPTSPRFLRPDLARVLADRMRGRTQLVAIYCDPSDDLIVASMKSLKPDFIQLHGNESVDRVAAIRGRFGVRVVKAVAVA